MKKEQKNKKAQKEASDARALRGGDSVGEGGREMVTKLQRRALTKEGYRIIGTHSAVKLCRWTKVTVNVEEWRQLLELSLSHDRFVYFVAFYVTIYNLSMMYVH
jgi:hypothetical protein